MEFVDDGAYFDQSHLIKDYQEFSGNTPNFILKRNNSYQQEIIKTGNQILAPTES